MRLCPIRVSITTRGHFWVIDWNGNWVVAVVHYHMRLYTYCTYMQPNGRNESTKKAQLPHTCGLHTLSHTHISRSQLSIPLFVFILLHLFSSIPITSLIHRNLVMPSSSYAITKGVVPIYSLFVWTALPLSLLSALLLHFLIHPLFCAPLLYPMWLPYWPFVDSVRRALVCLFAICSYMCMRMYRYYTYSFIWPTTYTTPSILR